MITQEESTLITSDEADVHLTLRGLARIYTATWPYITALLRHFLVLLTLTLTLIGFDTVVAFLGFDILWDSVGSSEPLSRDQARFMLLPEHPYAGTETLDTASRKTILLHFLVLSIVLTVITISANTLLRTYKVWILQQINQKLRSDMLRNAQELSLQFHSNAKAGDAIYRVFQDSAMVTAVIDNIVVIPVIALSTLLMQFVIASLFSPWFSFLISVYVLGLFFLCVWSAPRLRVDSADARTASANLFARIQETFQSIQLVKAYGFEKSSNLVFQEESLTALDKSLRIRHKFATVKVVTSFVLTSGLFLTDYFATVFVIDGTQVFGASFLVYFGLNVTIWSIAGYQARGAALGRFNGTLESLINVWCLAQDMAIGLNRSFWLLEQKAKVIDPPKPLPFPELIQEVNFEGVGFKYESNVVLENLSLAARTGQMVALVGPSGSGKSTLMSLLLRVFDPIQGHITINKTDISNFRLSDLRNQIAIALQENTLFPMTVRENLTYPQHDFSEDQIRMALEVACADFVYQLPQGLETELGINGSLLSTGQKQRLSIARAVVKDPQILILDEPTASLDSETERDVIENLKKWASGRIVFIITHRLNTVRNSSTIAFVNEGTILETGTHEDLLAARRDYYDFARKVL